MNLPDKKEYTTPEIIFETDLETKAGSPLGLPTDDLFELPDFED